MHEHRPGWPSDEVKRICVEAIRRFSAGTSLDECVAVWSMMHDGETRVYVNDIPRDEVPEGGKYTTFIVRIGPDCTAGEVTSFRSRKRGSFDDTLPP